MFQAFQARRLIRCTRYRCRFCHCDCAGGVRSFIACLSAVALFEFAISSTADAESVAPLLSVVELAILRMKLAKVVCRRSPVALLCVDCALGEVELCVVSMVAMGTVDATFLTGDAKGTSVCCCSGVSFDV